MKKLNLTNKTFHRLTVLHEVPSNSGSAWKCVCVCGNTVTVLTNNLQKGHTKSCGCYRKEVLSKKAKITATKHGDSTTRLYQIWKGIIRRCTTPSSSAYASYGAKGITVISEWKSYLAFKNWAIASGYLDTLTIDRVDSTQGYFPENCRWVNYQIQTRNRRKTVKQRTSKFIGVSYNSQNNKWYAYITIDKKFRYLGSFLCEIDAAKARDTYITENSLEGFKLNF